MTRVCRLCLNDITKYETPDDCTTYKTQIESFLPEVDVNATFTFILCNQCSNSLNSACTFKNECLRVEQLINDYRKEFSKLFIDLRELKNQQLSDCKELISISEVNIETPLDDCADSVDGLQNVDVLEEDPFQHLNESHESNHVCKTEEKNNDEEISRNSQSFTCEICSQSFQESSALETHLKTHTKQSEYTCGLCCKVFTKKCLLTEHSFSHKDKKNYHCKVCNKGFNGRFALRLHEEAHTGTKYDCTMCTKSFTGEYYLKSHQANTHFGSHICETCGMNFGKKYDLGQHVRTHTGDRPYKCEVCGKGFAQKSTLTLHIKCIHVEYKPYVCDICGRGFAYKTGLKEHKLTHTDKEEKKFFCRIDDCNRSFTTARYLRQHVRRHTLQRNFKCSVCEMGFTVANALARHVRTHTGERPYECDICHKSFREKYNLDRHLKSHRPERIVVVRG